MTAIKYSELDKSDSPRRTAMCRERVVAFCAVVVVLALACAVPALAEPGDDFNPQPKPDDFILPMPNGARMVFRPVFLGVGEGKIAEKTFRAGDRTGAHEKEKLTKVTLGGSFVDPARKDWLFYIGKYEVTTAQFGAFRAELAQTENLAQRSRNPQTGVTRSEVEAFVDAYNIWLRAGHVSKLPRYEGAPGYLRLPSEQEWEFAARGGVAVPAERFEKAVPYEGEIAKYEWFSGSRSSHGKLKEIGLLEPNPLGIHDLLGNAAEMTSTPYQIQIGQGKSGGFTVRGGSFRTAAEDLRSSLRTEQPLFGRDGLAPRDDTIGFRLVIASQVITDDNRQALELAARTPATMPPADAPSNAAPELAAVVAKLLALPADAPGSAAPELKALITSIMWRLQIIENQRKGLTLGGAVVAAKDSRVRVIRVEPMYFRTAISRMAVPGEVFTVAAHNPASKRVFLISTDTKGAPVALNVEQEACEMVLRDAEAIFTDALVALRNAKFSAALPLLQQAATLDPHELAYAQIRDAAQRLAQALRERERDLAKQNEKKERQISEKKIKDAGATFAAFTLSQAEAGSYDIAAAAQCCLSACDSSLLGLSARLKVPVLGLSARLKVPVKTGAGTRTKYISVAEMLALITQACAFYDQAMQACRERQLYGCRKLIASGLDAMPGHRPLQKLRVEVEGDIGLTEQAVKLASALEQNAGTSGVRELTKTARLLCQDCTALAELIARMGSE